MAYFICDEKGCYERATTRFNRLPPGEDGADRPVYFCDGHAHQAERTCELAEGQGRDLPYEFVEWLDTEQAGRI